MIDPSRGGKPAEMSAEQARNLPEQADMDGPLLRWKERDIRLEVEGKEKPGAARHFGYGSRSRTGSSGTWISTRETFGRSSGRASSAREIRSG